MTDDSLLDLIQEDKWIFDLPIVIALSGVLALLGVFDNYAPTTSGEMFIFCLLVCLGIVIIGFIALIFNKFYPGWLEY